MRSTYYVAINVNEVYSLADYEVESGLITSALSELFTDKATIGALTRDAELTTSNCECEVTQEDESGLRVKCVFDFDAEKRVTLDKGKLTSAIRSGLRPYPKMKIEKRQVAFEGPVD